MKEAPTKKKGTMAAARARVVGCGLVAGVNPTKSSLKHMITLNEAQIAAGILVVVEVSPYPKWDSSSGVGGQDVAIHSFPPMRMKTCTEWARRLLYTLQISGIQPKAATSRMRRHCGQLIHGQHCDRPSVRAPEPIPPTVRLVWSAYHAHVRVVRKEPLVTVPIVGPDIVVLPQPRLGGMDLAPPLPR